MTKIKKEKLLNFLLNAPDEIDFMDLAKFLEYQSEGKFRLVITSPDIIDRSI